MRAPELIFSQAYLQLVVRGAWKILNDFDVVLTPTLAQPPVPVGYFDEVNRRRTSSGRKGSPRSRPCITPGQPAVNLPLHWTGGGLPIGVMVAGPMGAEGLLISLSAQVRPPGHGGPASRRCGDYPVRPEVGGSSGGGARSPGGASTG